MTPRWTMRALACLTLVALTACANAAEPTRTGRPNEVQVFEPDGQPDRWTYTPNTLSIAAGTTVTFANHGKEFHTATSDDPGRLFDISLDVNKSATFTFTKAGTFSYHCGVHPQMKGVIRVCDGACS
jgi:plastocyanin